MADFDLRLLPSVIAVVAYFLFSMAWFIAMTGTWAAGFGWTKEEHAEQLRSRNMGLVFAVQMALNIATAILIGYVVIDVAGASTIAHGAAYGVTLGLLALLPHAGALWFENRPGSLQLIYGAHKLIAFAVVGGVYGCWGP